MRLVEVPAVERDLGETPRAGPAQRGDRAIEADHSRQRLRREPDLLAEARDQTTVTPAQLVGQGADRREAMRPPEVLPGPLHARRGQRRVDEATQKERLDELEAPGPRSRLAHTAGQLSRTRHEIIERNGAIRELVHRDAQESMRSERRQPQLDACPFATAPNARRSRGQTREHGVVSLRDPGHAALVRNFPGFSEVDDQRDAGERTSRSSGAVPRICAQPSGAAIRYGRNSGRAGRRATSQLEVSLSCRSTCTPAAYALTVQLDRHQLDVDAASATDESDADGATDRVADHQLVKLIHAGDRLVVHPDDQILGAKARRGRRAVLDHLHDLDAALLSELASEPRRQRARTACDAE